MLCVKAAGSTIVAYPYSPTDLIRDNPCTSWPSAPLSVATLAEWGVFPVALAAQPAFDPRIQRVAEASPVCSGGVWSQRWTVTPLTADEIAAINDQQAADVRADRTARLAACDWTQLADAPVNSLAWANYRQALRDIPKQPGFPWAVEWPPAPA